MSKRLPWLLFNRVQFSKLNLPPPPLPRMFSAFVGRCWLPHLLGAPPLSTYQPTPVGLLVGAGSLIIQIESCAPLPPRMFSAFVGYLSPSETLLLWDRVIGYDSLLPLPLLAVAVMTFRWAAATDLFVYTLALPSALGAPYLVSNYISPHPKIPLTSGVICCWLPLRQTSWLRLPI